MNKREMERYERVYRYVGGSLLFAWYLDDPLPYDLQPRSNDLCVLCAFANLIRHLYPVPGGDWLTLAGPYLVGVVTLYLIPHVLS